MCVCLCVCVYIYIRKNFERWEEHVERIGERRVAYRILMGKPEGKRPLGRPRHRWEDNITWLRVKTGGGLL